MKRTSSHEDLQFSRRAALKGLAAAAGLVTIPGALAACSSQHEQAASRQAGCRRRPPGRAAAPSASARTTPTPRRSRPSRPWWPTPRRPPASTSRLTPSTTTPFRMTSRPTCKERRTTSPPGSPGTGCSTSRLRGCSTPIDDVWDKIGGELQRRGEVAVQGRGRSLLLRADLQLPVGGLLQQEHLHAEGLHRPRDLGRPDDPGQEDEVRRPHPVRLRRQGPVARARHVRHPEPAGQRLRLPHQADAQPGVVHGPAGHGRVQPVERAHALPAERRGRPHLAGRGEDPGEPSRRA